MKLQLKYNPTASGPVAAAFLRGVDPVSWVEEISQWTIDPELLECYILNDPSSNITAGLFVIFPKPAQNIPEKLLEPFLSVNDKLFIPLQAELFPVLHDTELSKLLIWHRQVMHPSLGFTGLEESDQLLLSSLFSFPETASMDWNLAHPGIPSLPCLQSIRFAQPKVEDLVKEFKEKLGEKKLEDIKGDDKAPSLLRKIGTDTAYHLLKGLFSVAALINKVLPPGSLFYTAPASGHSTSYGKESTGLFARLATWLESNLAALEAKREKEINRLLTMFDKNTDEALQYAIPINSHYLDRGKDRASNTLSRRSINFNLRSLGGGYAADPWNIHSDHLFHLRKKYTEAAAKAIEGKDYRKAAYVYAHLLGDHYNAARALEDGGFHREAAAIHIEHLKNKPAAAECYRKGGLYLEAIDLHTEMGNDEVAGDLYEILRQPEKARSAYEKSVATKLAQQNHLDASRVLDEKMKECLEAKKVLLNGWSSYSNSEQCLKKYYDLTLEKQPEELISEIRTVYQHNVTEKNQLSFLSVLEYVNKKKVDAELQETAQDLAFEIVHNRIEKNEVNTLNRLNAFLPTDKLLKADISRYINNPTTIRAAKAAPALHLGKDTVWKSAIIKHHFFVAAGVMKNTLCLVRGNQFGYTEHYVLSDQIDPEILLEFVSEPYSGSSIYLHSSNFNLRNIEVMLPRNKHFNHSAKLICPVDNRNIYGICQDTLISVRKEFGRLCLRHYDHQGNFLESTELSINDEPLEADIHFGLPGRSQYYYFSSGNRLYIGSLSGKCKMIELDAWIHHFTISEYHPSHVFIVLSTSEGCFLGRIEGDNIVFISQGFAQDINVTAISFLKWKYFSVTGENSVRIFNTSACQEVALFTAQSRIIAVLPATTPDECAVFEESGEIFIHKLPA